MRSSYATLDNGKVVIHQVQQCSSTQFSIGDLVVTRMHRPFSAPKEIHGFIYALAQYDDQCIYAIVAYNGKRYYSNDVSVARRFVNDGTLADYLQKL